MAERNRSGKRTFTFDLNNFESLSGDDLDKFKLWADIVKNIPKPEYIFSKGSSGVFYGGSYIGQGKLSGSSLIVEKHFKVTLENFALSHITNLN